MRNRIGKMRIEGATQLCMTRKKNTTDKTVI